MSRWILLTRPTDWVGSKLPFLAVATVLLAPDSTSAPRILAIVLTIVAGSAFGYALNEVADRASDTRAGKANRASGLGRGGWLPPVILSAGGAIGLSVAWAPDAAAPALTVAGLGLAFAYSVPPLRLKERGAAGIVAGAAAQWTVPVLVVAAVEPGGWNDGSALALAALGLAIGTRSMVVHQLRDASADRRAGVRTRFSRGSAGGGALQFALACEIVLLAAALAWLWPASAAAAIALVPFVAIELVPFPARRPLFARLKGYEQAPLAGYYFVALPLALAVEIVVTGDRSAAVAATLAATAVPYLIGSLRSRDAGRFAVNRTMASRQRAVVSASEPHP